MQKIKRYSDVIPYEERRFWYFTLHGSGPGIKPADLNILEVRETPNGDYILLDGVLNTAELEKYEMKEKVPE